MKILEKMLFGCKFVGVGIASASCCSSVSLSVVPQVRVGGELGCSSSSDCLLGVSLVSLDVSISPQSD